MRNGAFEEGRTGYMSDYCCSSGPIEQEPVLRLLDQDEKETESPCPGSLHREETLLRSVVVDLDGSSLSLRPVVKRLEFDPRQGAVHIRRPQQTWILHRETVQRFQRASHSCPLGLLAHDIRS